MNISVMNVMALPAPLRAKMKWSAQQVVAAGELPEPAVKLILRVVREARLWKREQAAVAEELVAHFRDGLESGRSAEDLAATFGDPAVAAKLIRRAKRRARPLWWRAGRRCVAGTLLVVLLYATAALLLATREPRLTADYVAEMNRALPSAPEAEQAWPIYRPALLRDSADAVRADLFNPMDVDADGKPLAPPPQPWPPPDFFGYSNWTPPPEQPAGPAPYELRPADGAWPRAVAVLEKHRGLLDAAREGGLKPVYGLRAAPLGHYGDEDRRALGLGAVAALPRDDPRASLLAVTWNAVSHPMRQLVYLLAVDAWRAAADGDAARAAENYRSMLGVARHCREIPSLVNQVVSADMANVANRTLAEIDRAYPRLLDGRRVGLIRASAAAAGGMFDLDLSVDRKVILDMVQRTYSDDGRGDGTLTYEGICAIVHDVHAATDRPRRELTLEEKGAYLASLPAAAAAGASRREVTETVDRFYAAAAANVRRPMWERLGAAPDPAGDTPDWYRQVIHLRNLLASLLLPDSDRIALRLDAARALHEATTTALALEVWRERHGRYPASLEELVPQYLPKVPADHSAGRALRYRLKEGVPLLYGVGRNGTDEGGVAPQPYARWPEVPDDADWVLHPPVKHR